MLQDFLKEFWKDSRYVWLVWRWQALQTALEQMSLFEDTEIKNAAEAGAAMDEIRMKFEMIRSPVVLWTAMHGLGEKQHRWKRKTEKEP